MAFVFGVNYPWIACGHDFGPRPPPWAGGRGTEWSKVQADFEELAGLGMSVVRLWVLAGGVNYPIGKDPIEVADRVRDERGDEHFVLRGDPPPLTSEFLEDFERLLLACRNARLALLPSLVSFELFLPIEMQSGGVASRGRGDFVLRSHRGAFFDAVLEPLLELSEGYRDAIFAWEVMNEPDWVAAPYEERDYACVSPLAMSDFLVEGCRRIVRRSFLSTIGFGRARPHWLPPSARMSLTRFAERGAYLHQLHCYPMENKSSRLPPARESAIAPCLVGELPTAQYGRWVDPELRSTESDPNRYLAARIALAKERGYTGALLWSCRAQDPHTSWDARVKAQVSMSSGGRL